MNMINPDPSYRILIVEDEALLAEELQDRLEHLGHTVLGVVDTGTDALARTEALRPDLVLMDIRIKGPVNGIETADRIYREFGIPVVFSSAHSDRDTLQQAQISGQFGYIIKPYREQDLVMAIRLAMHRYHTEASVHKSQLTYAMLLANVGEGVIVADGYGTIRFMNLAAEKLTGWDMNDARDRLIDEVVQLRHEDSRQSAQVRDIKHRSVDVNAGWEGESYVLVSRNGSETQVDAVLTPVYGHNGNILGNALMLRSTSSRRQAERRFRDLILASPNPVVICDEQGRIRMTNQRAEAAHGYSRDELIGEPMKTLIPERLHEHFGKLLEQHVREPSLQQLGMEQELFALRRDGSEFPVEFSISSIRTDNGLSICFVARDMTDKYTDSQLAWKQANIDPLTGLPNRHQFRDRLAWSMKRADENGSQLALLMLDLDHFKEINDTLGHDAGDKLLKMVAKRIQNLIRDTDVLARLGGDEFTVIMPGLSDMQPVEHIAQRLVRELAQPFLISNRNFYLTTSIGITVHPNDARNAEDLIKHADQAMYAAKTAGRNRFMYFSGDMQQSVERRRSLINDLHGALQRNEFSIHYQPIIDLKTGLATKAEALLRWTHPVHGPIKPLDFIPLLEETGVVHEIGEWVFDQTASQALRVEGLLGRPMQISVNISTAQFSPRGYGAIDWARKLSSLEGPKSRVAIEITESMLVQDPKSVKERLAEFRENGIGISVDDFGTGFSSLAYLKMFNIDYLKIDASFTRGVVDDENDQALTEAIIVMAHKLGIKTIAEGVETEGQRQALANMGCDYAQGYLFSPPLPSAEFEQYLLKRERRLAEKSAQAAE